MKNKKLQGGLLCGCCASLLLAVASALVMGLWSGMPKSAETALGVAAVLAGISFSLCCSSWLERAFQAAAGLTLSDYFRQLHSGIGRGDRA